MSVSNNKILSDPDQMLPLEIKILSSIAGFPVSPAQAPWLLAVSGGADSVAMLQVLFRLFRMNQLPCRKLVMAHLNHTLRGQDSDQDAVFVRDLAKDLGLDCYCERADIAQLARDQKISIETAARNARYDFLAGVAMESGCDTIAVAHNADDQVETVLHRILRGTGLKGLAGMAPIRPLREGKSMLLIRPLLACTRKEILDYLAGINQQWREDRSNADTSFTRNRIRNELLPLLRQQYNPQINNALIQLSELTRQANSLLGNMTEPLLAGIILEHHESRIVIGLKQFSDCSKSWQIRILYEVLHRLDVPLDRLGMKQIQLLCEFAGKNRTGRLGMSGGLIAERYADRLEFRIGGKNHCIEIQPIELPGQSVVTVANGLLWYDLQAKKSYPINSLTRQKEILSQDKKTINFNGKTAGFEWIDADRLQEPLFIRNRQPGDTIHPLGAPGGKKVGDLMTDLKIPISIRDRLGVICDQAGLIWIAGLRLDNRVRLTKKSKKIEKISVL